MLAASLLISRFVSTLSRGIVSPTHRRPTHAGDFWNRKPDPRFGCSRIPGGLRGLRPAATSFATLRVAAPIDLLQQLPRARRLAPGLVLTAAPQLRKRVRLASDRTHSAAIRSHTAPDQTRYAPTSIRFAPDRIRFSPRTIRFAPDQTRSAPRRIRFAPDQARSAPKRVIFKADFAKIAPNQVRFVRSAD
jgi:hypothetical protein